MPRAPTSRPGHTCPRALFRSLLPLLGLGVMWVSLALPAPAAAEEPIARAMRALRKDGSHKVRTQAALVLGRERVREAVPLLSEALTTDDSASVRVAAAVALGKIGDLAGRRALEEARHNDPDNDVREAAKRALAALAESGQGTGSALAIEAATGEGDTQTRGALGTALNRHLKAKGFRTDPGSGGKAVYRVKPAIQSLTIASEGNQVSVAVQVSVVAIEMGGRVAAMLQSGARLRASGAKPTPALEARLAEQALDAAARTLSEDLATKLQ